MTYTYNESGVTYNQTGVTYDGDTALGLSNLPVVGVFVAFDDGPYVADPDWVEVTDYVRDVSIRRGRQDDLQQFPSGSCSITFDNRDRLFDPFNTAGTYYGKLKPRRQVRVVGQWNGVNYPLFRGFVAGWPVEFSEGGKDSTVTVDCFDALGLMANETVPFDWVEDYTLSLSPTHYWRFNESQPITSSKDAIGGWNLTTFSTNVVAPYETNALANGFLSNAIYFRQWQYLVLDVPDWTGTVTLAGWIRLSTDTGFQSVILFHDSAMSFTIGINSTKIGIAVGGTTGVATPTVYESNYSFDPPQGSLNDPVHVAIVSTYNASTYPTVSVYFNGQLQTLPTPSNSTYTSARRDTLYLKSVTVQEFSSYRRALTQAEITNLYDLGSGRIKETVLDRLNRVVGKTLFPSALESFSVSPIASVSEISSRNGVIPEVNRVVDSENGQLFISASGVLTFVDRYGWSENTRSNTSQATFTDTGTGVYYDAGSVRINLDADQVRNDSTVQFSSGGVVTSTDSTSVAEYGAASEQISTFLPDPASAQTLADYRVSIFKTPKLRVEPFLVKGQRNPSYDWPRLLNLELLDRFTFVRTPSVGSAIQRDMLLQSIEHRITPGTWETTINGSARYTGWFILGVSLLGSTEDVLL